MRSLAVVLVQYDRRKYPAALRRLVQKTNALKSTKTTIVVVDNLLPGDWYHEVSPDLFHLGGDNTAWEFSAFDRGCRFLAERQRPTDLYAFVTDAFTAYGDEFLELIDDQTLDYTFELQACSGWVDSIFQPFQAFNYEYAQYLRTSFLLTTPQTLAQLGPLATPIASEALFSGDPATPFRQDAPLSQNLQDFLLTWLTGASTRVDLERVWHSRFDLSAETLPLFEAKTLAILREHLLSARLLSQGTPCFDFRLLSKLAERRVTPHQVSFENRKRWQWLHWRDTPIDFEPRFFIEECFIPEAVVHGDKARAELRGWVVTEPQVPEVYLQLAPDRRYPVSCDIPRSDGLPGFEVSLDLQHVPPGSYDVEWVIPTPKPRHHRVGSLRVTPCHQFTLNRLFLPQKSVDRTLPIALQGEFQTTFALRKVRPKWNDQVIDLQILSHEKPRASNGLFVYSILCNDTFTVHEEREQHLLSLAFETTNGSTYTWNRNALVMPSNTVAHQISRRQIGPYDISSGLTTLHLQGLVFTDCPKGRIRLLHEGRTILEESLTWIREAPKAPGDSALGRFDYRRLLANLPAGTWDFELQLSEQQGQKNHTLLTWRDTIRVLEPIIHVDQVVVEPSRRQRNHHILRLIGWIENDFIVDYLTLEINGEESGIFGLNQLRPDAAQETHQTLVRRQGFHIEQAIELAPGTHDLRLVSGQVDGACGIWQQPLRVEEPIPDRFHFESLDIERLTASTPSHFWSSLELSGRIHSQLPNTVAKLYIDGQKVDEQLAADGQDFSLRYVPSESGDVLVRVLLESGRSVLYDSQTVTAHLQALQTPAEMSQILEHLLHHFDIRDPLLQEDMEATCRGLIERNLEDFPAFMQRLGQLEKVLRRSSSQTNDRFVDITQLPAPDLPKGPLRILFACWEVPSLRHGGGVCMSNLLKGLAQQHQVTVLHPFSLEESGWIEDVRSHVTKIISVPREHRPITYRHDRGIPEHYFANYVPSLKQALESELATGNYDVVNYEYTTMFAHISTAPTPKALVVHELGFSAKLTTYFKENLRLDESLDELQDLLETLHFYTDSLPAACDHLIALTEEDGRALARLQGPETRVFVNTIGVDEARFEPPEIMGEDDAPTLVFLGNYRHPPNVHAAKFYAEKVMPKLALRHPKAKFLIIGSHVPPELESAAQHPNIEITGFVDDFRPYLWRATAFVAPIFVGAGMRVKILEAMACGCPMISTELGMNGLGGTADTHYLEAASAEDFVDATCRLIERPALGEKLGQAARQLILGHHSWRHKAAEREAVWAHLLQRESLQRESLQRESLQPGSPQPGSPQPGSPQPEPLDTTPDMAPADPTLEPKKQPALS